MNVEADEKIGMDAATSRHVIERFVRPRSVAVVGASDRMDYGGRLLRNLREGGFAGAIYPVNPRRAEVQGMRAWADVRDIPEAADLAVVVVPGQAIAGVIEACGKRGVGACAIITAGFGERGAEGEREQEALLSVARQAGVRLSGPNSLGVANITERIFATASSSVDWGQEKARPAGISVISQSGALSFNPVPRRAAARGIGLRAIVSVGNQADLTVVDFLEYFVDADEETKVVALFLEGLPAGEGPRLLAAARRARLKGKPILAVKVGRSPGTAAVARSHTAALTGDDAIYEGAFRAAGIVRVEDLDDLWEAGALFAATGGFRPAGGVGGGLGFLSNSGGMNSLFADLCAVHGAPLASLGTPTVTGIETVLAGFGAAGNPADVTGNFVRPALIDLLDLFAADPAVDLLVTGTTSGAEGQRSRDIAGNILTAREHTEKPLVMLWFAPPPTEEDSGLISLREAGLPIFHEPAKCARALGWLYAYHRAYHRHATEGKEAGPEIREGIARKDWKETQADALALLAEAGIPVAGVFAPASAAEAAAIAGQIGFPLVLKIEAPGLRHKTELGGVRVGIGDPASLARAWDALWRETAALGPARRVLIQKQVTGGLELLLGGRIDPVFGPVVALGAGGTAVEIERDIAFRPAPLGAAMVREMLGELRIGRRFGTVRGGKPRDVEALIEAVLRFGALMEALAETRTEIEINPLMLLEAGSGVCAVDARITLVDRKGV